MRFFSDYFYVFSKFRPLNKKMCYSINCLAANENSFFSAEITCKHRKLPISLADSGKVVGFNLPDVNHFCFPAFSLSIREKNRISVYKISEISEMLVEIVSGNYQLIRRNTVVRISAGSQPQKSFRILCHNRKLQAYNGYFKCSAYHPFPDAVSAVRHK